MKTPKISVVLCSYNGEAYIEQQIDSILNQTKLPDELIVSDDCSSDSTVSIASDIARKYPNLIRLVESKTNLGFIKNFEKAIALAKGELIFLSDQDDVWFDQKIENMMQPFLDYEDVGLVYSDALITDSELNPTAHTLFETRSRKGFMLDKERTASILIKGVGINGCTMAFRSALNDIVLPIGEGWGHDHWIAFVSHAVTVVMPTGQSLMCYRWHGDSAGNHRLLEHGRINAWKSGRKMASQDEYGRDLNRWKAMTQRLNEIHEKQSVAWVDYTKLGIFLRECEQRTELARLRKRMKGKRRLHRLPDVLHILSVGHYRQYLHGIKSLTKDLLIR